MSDWRNIDPVDWDLDDYRDACVYIVEMMGKRQDVATKLDRMEKSFRRYEDRKAIKDKG